MDTSARWAGLQDIVLFVVLGPLPFEVVQGDRNAGINLVSNYSHEYGEL
jgi:hypothetical protein